ncbi:MAG: hypothetical protein ACYC4I_02340 [Minisyncoccota bacterium]
MDTGKLLKIIQDIQSDEQTLKLQAIFQNIFNFYVQNNPDGLNNEESTLLERISQAKVTGYVLTDFSALQKLNVAQFFGDGARDSLRDILSKQAHEVKPILEKFIQERQDTLNNLNKLGDSLKAFRLEARILSGQQYEIGFALPANYQDIANLERLLGDVKNFLNHLAEVGGEKTQLKITSVSNGSIQFFIEVGIKVAEHFDLILGYALKIYAAGKMCADLKKGYEHFTQGRKRQVDELAEAEYKETKEHLVDDMVKSLGITKPEEITAIRQLFNKVLRHLENGVAAEVRTPAIEAPREPAEADTVEVKKQLAAQKKAHDIKHQIDERNKEIFLLQQNKFDGIQLSLPEAGVSVEPDIKKLGGEE